MLYAETPKTAPVELVLVVLGRFFLLIHLFGPGRLLARMGSGAFVADTSPLALIKLGTHLRLKRGGR